VKLPLLTSVAALSLSAAASHAAVIGYVGSVEDSSVNEWRTATTPKPLDIDGDNIFGSFGAVHWTVAGLNEFPAASASPGWHYAGETTFGQFRNPDYAIIDNPVTPGTDIEGGIGAVQFPGTFTFEMTGTPETYAGRTLRVGIMADILGAGEWAADSGKSYSLSQITGGTSDSGPITLRAGAAANGQPELYFFDLTGVNPGDVFRITAFPSPGGFPGYIGPVTWDLGAAIPEPSTSFLAAAAASSALLRRRRRSKAVPALSPN
jgi:hypothetical protein